ncbi:hypothetical protein VCSRO97_1844 [Vibrio cholerae]|nr:hypothetical protein VCSRO97_1844 [Vibrio cholerae]
MFPASLNLYHKGIGAGEIPHPNPPLKGEGIQINPLLLQREFTLPKGECFAPPPSRGWQGGGIVSSFTQPFITKALVLVNYPTLTLP